MTPIDSLAISLPILLSVGMFIIAFQNYKLNKKKDSKSDTSEEIERQKAEDERQKENELRLVAIEKDVQYIRIGIDNIIDTQKNHEQRINKLEVHCKNQEKW